MKTGWFGPQEIKLPPGACSTCGGEGQEQHLDAFGEPSARVCMRCRGTGNAKKTDNQHLAAALTATNTWITDNPDSRGEHFIVIRDALRELLAVRSLIDGDDITGDLDRMRKWMEENDVTMLTVNNITIRTRR